MNLLFQNSNDKKTPNRSGIKAFVQPVLENIIAEAESLATACTLLVSWNKLATLVMRFTEHRPSRLDLFCYRLHVCF